MSKAIDERRRGNTEANRPNVIYFLRTRQKFLTYEQKDNTKYFCNNFYGNRYCPIFKNFGGYKSF